MHSSIMHKNFLHYVVMGRTGCEPHVNNGKNPEHSIMAKGKLVVQRESGDQHMLGLFHDDTVTVS